MDNIEGPVDTTSIRDAEGERDVKRSERLRALSEKINGGFTSFGNTLKTATSFGKIVLLLGGGFLAGAAQFAPTEYAAAGRLVGLIGVALVFIGGLWSLIVEKGTPDTLLEAKKAIDEAAEIQNEVRALSVSIAGSETSSAR